MVEQKPSNDYEGVAEAHKGSSQSNSSPSKTSLLLSRRESADTVSENIQDIDIETMEVMWSTLYDKIIDKGKLYLCLPRR